MLSTLCRLSATPIRSPEVISRIHLFSTELKSQLNPINFRNFKTDVSLRADKQFTRRAKERMGFKEMINAKSTGRPLAIGHGAMIGASVVGLGALCYYGLGFSNETGAMERSLMWPQYVRDRIHSTYGYFGGSIIFTAASAAAVFRSPTMLSMMQKSSFLAIAGTFVALIGSGMVCRSIPYSPGFGKKQLAWMVHCGIMGAVVAPLCILGGPLILRAATMTAGIIGGLSTIAVCAPSEKFLNMAGPLAVGFGVVLASSIGSMFFPFGSALGVSLYSISLYGGLLLFSGFMLYDTQKIVQMAEVLPAHVIYDPVNASMGIYINTMNIFIRIVQIFAMGNSRRK